MDCSKKISVLMGIYNCAKTLPEAVDCILNQTYTNWELIMIDDGSKDDTYEVACALAESDSRIKVFKNEKNITLAPTLNRCATHATGEYLARMDGDDVCDSTRFEKEIDFLETHPEYALVSCQMALYDENGIYGVVNHIENPTKKGLLKRSQFCHAGCMMRKSVFDNLGGYSESSNYVRVEDYDLWTRMYKAGYKGYNLQEVLYSMRDDRNANRRRTLKNRINEVRVKRNVCKWFKLPLYCYLYTLIPLIKAITPGFVYKLKHRG